MTENNNWIKRTLITAGVAVGLAGAVYVVANHDFQFEKTNHIEECGGLGYEVSGKKSLMNGYSNLEGSLITQSGKTLFPLEFEVDKEGQIDIDVQESLYSAGLRRNDDGSVDAKSSALSVLSQVKDLTLGDTFSRGSDLYKAAQSLDAEKCGTAIKYSLRD
jgi:hypothetical protein